MQRSRQRTEWSEDRQPARDRPAARREDSGGAAVPPPLTAAALRAAQRGAGNAAVTGMIARRARTAPAPEQPDVEVHEVLRSAGKPLAAPVRQEMEARLGTDFSDVRLHTGAAAARSARAIGARAYTSGSHVVIGDGGGDKHTLAHELTHVVQQRQGPVSGTDNGAGLRISDPSDRFEREAEANATRALAGPVPSAEHASEGPVGPYHAAGGSVLQRRVVELKKGPPDAAETRLFEEFSAAVDRAVQWAYNYVTTAPQLGPLADYDGHTKHWVDVWQDFHANGRSGGISKEFGYAIESVAHAHLKGAGRPSLPAETHFGTQVTFGSTRPDYVLYMRGNPIGAVDITAEASIGHVRDKTGWDALFPQFGESLYTSLDATVIAAMKLAHGNAAPLTQQQADQLKQQAAANRAMWEENWRLMATSFKEDMRNKGIVDDMGRVKGGGDPVVREGQRRGAVFSWMTENLGVDQAAAERNATVMLLKFNPSWPGSFSCNDSTASVSRGEAFLTSVFPEWERSRS
ncbi:eCIS core domain-containing protein [Streptomyces radiopugnans]|uniref:eCIS core domain-containing protein n=1 Tax=Streptomyces radiopugnans TaxID=403935 RepID=UPI003F1D1B5B